MLMMFPLPFDLLSVESFGKSSLFYNILSFSYTFQYLQTKMVIGHEPHGLHYLLDGDEPEVSAFAFAFAKSVTQWLIRLGHASLRLKL